MSEESVISLPTTVLLQDSGLVTSAIEYCSLFITQDQVLHDKLPPGYGDNKVRSLPAVFQPWFRCFVAGV